MPCVRRCPTLSGTTIPEVWEELRYYYGPRNRGEDFEIELRAADIAEFTEWATEKGRDDTDYVLFGKWFQWRLSVGTADYGNLPSYKKPSHEGISGVPCPYDLKPSNMSQDSWDLRLRHWLGGAPSSTNSHVDGTGKHYYMKVSSRGGLWGFECTYENCPYKITYGYSYFYI
jgi:hypothetical protein